ncbi:MAG: VWA domain-containing protein, partial [Turneriella sp.]|nr:VWA domain-containing protein [Turneriella sp.]
MAVAAQPYFLARIVSVRASGNTIEVLVQTEKSSEYDSLAESTPQFSLSENGAPQQVQIETLPQANEVSRTVILADLSKSLSRQQFADFKRAAQDFVAGLKANDLVALITFHRKVRRELNFTADRELLKKKIAGLRQQGRRTMLYEALLEAHKMLRDAPPRRAIIVYTDG